MPNDTAQIINRFAPAGTTIFLAATAKGKLAKPKPRTVHKVDRNALYLIDDTGKMAYRPIISAKITDEGNLEINTNTDRYALFTK